MKKLKIAQSICTLMWVHKYTTPVQGAKSNSIESCFTARILIYLSQQHDENMENKSYEVPKWVKGNILSSAAV